MDKIQINGGILDVTKAFKVVAKLPDDEQTRKFIVFTEDKDFAERKIKQLSEKVPTLEPIPLDIADIEEVEIQIK